MKPVNIWPFQEISTRNCVHSRVTFLGKRKALSKVRVYCDKRPLAQQMRYDDPLNSIVIQRVLNCSSWASPSCRGCLDFETDIDA